MTRSDQGPAGEQQVPLPQDRPEDRELSDQSSLEADSLSLRYMAANGLTPDGQLQRLALAAEMSNTRGWRGRRALKALLVIILVFWLASVAFQAIGIFSH
jgi:hypothetical protein